MYDIQTFSDVPTFGASASKVKPGDTKYANGFIGEERYPAEYHNWFLAGLTANGNQEQDSINNVLLELKNLLALKSVSPDPEDDDQVASVTQDLIDDIILISGLTEKTTIVADDILLMNDSAASYVAKKVKHSTIKTDIQNFYDLTEKTTPAGDDVFPINDSAASYVPKKVTMTNMLDYITDNIALAFSEKYNITSKTASWTIADTDNYDMYLIVHGDTTKEVIVTLPTLADNQGLIIRMKNVGNGIARFYGEGGAELIDGKASQYIFGDGDIIWIVAGSTEWKILKHNFVLDTGEYYISDETNRQIGNVVVTMDNVAGTYEIGEIVREYSDAGHTTPTGRYGRIITKTSTTLTLIQVDGDARFTNNYYLQGKNSGATSDVNGNSLNASAPLYHGTGYSMGDLEKHLYLLSEKSEAGLISAAEIWSIGGGTVYASAFLGIDGNSFDFQTGVNGMAAQASSGAAVIYDNDVMYVKCLIIRKS